MEIGPRPVAPEKIFCYNKLIYYGQVLPKVLGVKRMDNIILIGMPGSGKSTAGKALAKALGKEFLDVDPVIEQREGAPLQRLLDTHGVEAFLDMEGAAICSVECENTVIAPGGSCICRESAMEHLRKLGTVVYLKLSYPEVERRIHNMADRGIALQPGQTLADVYDYRTPLYERYTHITVEADGQSLTQTVESIKLALAAENSR